MTEQPLIPDIDVRSLSFQYPDGQPALRNISFSIAPHEKVALVGANGSGKSTLLLHLNGILRSRTGMVSIHGMPLSDQTIPQIRAAIGLVFQNPDDQLFSPRVYEDVAFAARYQGLSEEEVGQRVSAALHAVRMEGYAQRLSHHLSIGEKKRIALATVLTMDAPILALDEPSAGLDPRARKDLTHLLRQFTDKTILISTHDMRFAAELCERVIVMDAGEIAADGPAHILLHDRDVMERHGLETVG